MKKLIPFFLLTFIVFSCSDSDDSGAIIPSIDTSKLAKVIFDPKTPSEKHWNFYTNGLLKEITEPDGTVLQTFVYDSKNNLLSSTIIAEPYNSHKFTYDNSNYITSLDGLLVDYNQNINLYTIHFNRPNSYDYLDTMEIFLNSEQLIINEKENFISITGNYYFQGLKTSYINNNMLHYYDGIQSEQNYEHDNYTNPFKHALFPICRALSITGFGNASTKWVNGEYTSKNNVIRNDLDDGPERYEYSYQYNLNNLPTKQTGYYFYINVLESTRISILYYYQGDVIPQ